MKIRSKFPRTQSSQIGGSASLFPVPPLAAAVHRVAYHLHHLPVLPGFLSTSLRLLTTISRRPATPPASAATYSAAGIRRPEPPSTSLSVSRRCHLPSPLDASGLRRHPLRHRHPPPGASINLSPSPDATISRHPTTPPAAAASSSASTSPPP